MNLDIKTLVVCNSATSFFMALGLLYYMINYKTYKGYGFWLSSTFVLSFAYLAMIFRPIIPLLLSIILTNISIVLVAVLRLDGVQRFTRDRKLKLVYYGLPILTIPFSLYFFLVIDNMILRNFFSSILLAILAILIGLELYQNRNTENSKLFTATTILIICYGLLIISRASLWFLYPKETLFATAIIHQLYFLLVTIIEVGVGISWIMMNSQRLETELRTSENDLKSTVNDLKKALSEVKTLSGIIPICMHCKEIRVDRGYWEKIETFISEHSEAEFSHGICPKCIKEKYPYLLKDGRHKDKE